MKTGVPSHSTVETPGSDGKVHTLEVTYAPEIDRRGSVTGVVCMAMDKTEERIIERQRDQLAMAVEQSQMAVMITDPAGTIEYVNPGFERVTGYSFAEACGATPSILRSAETPITFYEAMWDSLLTEGRWAGIVRNRRKNGDLYWERASIAAVRDVHGEVVEFVKVAEDITSLVTTREQLELQLQRSSALLREVFHRSKNNLQIVSSSISLQMNSIDQSEQNDVLREFAARIHGLVMTIASAHDYLEIWDDPDRVTMSDYLESVIVRAASRTGIALETNLEPFVRSIAEAVPLAIAINEVVTAVAAISPAGGVLTIMGGAAETARAAVTGYRIVGHLTAIDETSAIPAGCPDAFTENITLASVLISDQVSGRLTFDGCDFAIEMPDYATSPG
jgi:PAS domain S-box-containing protein